jgi:predicted site-specific integrase-resolvase
MSIRHMGQAALAERWGVSQRTLERWRWLGFGPRYIKIGGRVVYRADEIEAFEERQTRQSTSDKPVEAIVGGAAR